MSKTNQKQPPKKWDEMTPEEKTKAKRGLGCMGVIVFIIIAFAISKCDSHDAMPTESQVKIMAENLIEDQLKNTVNEIDFPFADYKFDNLNDSTYLVLSYFTYKNDYNVEKRFGFKSKVRYKGGSWNSIQNWELIYLEEYNY